MNQPPEPHAGAAPQQQQRPPGQPLLPSDFTTVLIFAALTLLFAPVFAPILWWLAGRELRRIEAGIAAPVRITELKIFRIIGIVLTVLLITGFVGALAVVAFATFLVAVGVSSG